MSAAFLYLKYVGRGPVNLTGLREVICREARAAERGRIRVSRDLLRELRADRARIGRICNQARARKAALAVVVEAHCEAAS